MLKNTIDYMRSLQRTDGYWWFTLEANETIGAEFIFLMYYLEAVDSDWLRGIANRILDVQRADGTWAIYYGGPACLSSTVECYFALKLAGIDVSRPEMVLAREFIIKNGGIEKTRVFTKIHLAMFGLVPWDAAAAMPAEFIFLPSWFFMNIYEFSSWARATIVPLLIFMSKRQVRIISPNFNLDELFVSPSGKRDYSFHTNKGFFTWESFFIYIDKLLKIYEKIPFKPFRKLALSKCANWTWAHIKETEDIYPALAYGALAFKALGYDNESPEIKKPFEALKMFQQSYATKELPALPDEIRDDGLNSPSKLRNAILATRHETRDTSRVHQQCCISPVWDTPWMCMALLEAGVPKNDPLLLRSGHWLMSKQITARYGDWAIKNPNVLPGGWSFEFENSYFPDIDDTIEVLHVINRLELPKKEKTRAMCLGIDWLLSMQNDDGGWGAFDKNQNCTLVNRIPFSDHGACLDPSSPDITGRMVEFMASQYFSRDNPQVRRAIDYIWRTQEPFGGWFARWGINFVYGTWCVLTGLKEIGWDLDDPRIQRAVTWLRSVQHPDGGFGESVESYDKKEYVPLGVSVPSQTAWALMALTAAGSAGLTPAKRAAEFLLNNRNKNGSWDEEQHTGTGFPCHFYIRYHGYRHYFPLLALARYFKSSSPPSSSRPSSSLARAL